MRVDLPAPLSPSTQVTSPALTVRLMPDRATMGPKDLPTSVHLDQRLAPVQGGVGVFRERVGHGVSPIDLSAVSAGWRRSS